MRIKSAKFNVRIPIYGSNSMESVNPESGVAIFLELELGALRVMLSPSVGAPAEPFMIPMANVLWWKPWSEEDETKEAKKGAKK